MILCCFSALGGYSHYHVTLASVPGPRDSIIYCGNAKIPIVECYPTFRVNKEFYRNYMQASELLKKCTETHQESANDT